MINFLEKLLRCRGSVPNNTTIPKAEIAMIISSAAGDPDCERDRAVMRGEEAVMYEFLPTLSKEQIQALNRHDGWMNLENISNPCELRKSYRQVFYRPDGRFTKTPRNRAG